MSLGADTIGWLYDSQCILCLYTEHYSTDQLAADGKLKDNNGLTYSPWMKVATVRRDKASISDRPLIWSVLSGSMGVCMCVHTCVRACPSIYVQRVGWMWRQWSPPGVWCCQASPTPTNPRPLTLMGLIGSYRTIPLKMTHVHMFSNFFIWSDVK